MRTRADDQGFTLVEMLIAMSLLLIALAMFGTTLWSVQRGGARQGELSQATDSAYQAITEMDRQLRSGYIASEARFSGADASLVDMVRIYTETYAAPGSDAAPNTVARCVAWVIVARGGAENLYSVWWTPKPGVAAPTYVPATGVFTIANVTGITNVSGFRLVTPNLTGSSLDSFKVQSATGGVSERLLVTLRLRESTDPALLTSPALGSPSPWVNEIRTTLTPRNSPRALMNADTAAYGPTPSPGSILRSVLCG